MCSSFNLFYTTKSYDMKYLLSGFKCWMGYIVAEQYMSYETRNRSTSLRSFVVFFKIAPVLILMCNGESVILVQRKTCVACCVDEGVLEPVLMRLRGV